jgi:hypothetical protein
VKSATTTSRGAKTKHRRENSQHGDSSGDGPQGVTAAPGNSEAVTAATPPARSESFTDRNG